MIVYMAHTQVAPGSHNVTGGVAGDIPPPSVSERLPSTPSVSQQTLIYGILTSTDALPILDTDGSDQRH